MDERSPGRAETVAPGKRFTRAELSPLDSKSTLRPAGWQSAHVFTFEWQGELWVIKDFRGASRLFRHLLGRLLTAREIRALSRLRGLEGVPADAFRIDSCALAYRFKPGDSMRQVLRKGIILDRGFFVRLEALVKEMHARGILHLDLRNAWNVLATPGQDPFIIDFQSSIGSRLLPRPIRRLFEDVDLSGVYKWWLRLSPGTFDAGRAARLRKMHGRRRLWPFQRFLLRFSPGKRLERGLPAPPGAAEGPARPAAGIPTRVLASHLEERR